MANLHEPDDSSKLTEKPRKRRRMRDVKDVAVRAQLFWGLVDSDGGPQACWPVVGLKPMWNGYYTTRFWSDKKEPCHRIAYEIANGRIDESDGRKVVLHKCDNRACANPAHLKLGTYSQNTIDMLDKGRGGSKPGVRRRLTIAQANEIRALYATGKVTQNELAAKYGIAAQNISILLQNRSYVSNSVVEEEARDVA